MGIGENSTGQFRISGNTLKLTEAESKTESQRDKIGIQWVVQDSNNQITPANNLQEDNQFIRHLQ